MGEIIFVVKKRGSGGASVAMDYACLQLISQKLYAGHQCTNICKELGSVKAWFSRFKSSLMMSWT
jgi:hypothetical protein